jgi:hypothetical protein
VVSQVFTVIRGVVKAQIHKEAITVGVGATFYVPPCTRGRQISWAGFFFLLEGLVGRVIAALGVCLAVNTYSISNPGKETALVSYLQVKEPELAEAAAP